MHHHLPPLHHSRPHTHHAHSHSLPKGLDSQAVNLMARPAYDPLSPQNQAQLVFEAFFEFSRLRNQRKLKCLNADAVSRPILLRLPHVLPSATLVVRIVFTQDRLPAWLALIPKYGDRQDFRQATDSGCFRCIIKDHSRRLSSGKAVGWGIVSAKMIVKLALSFPTGLCRVFPPCVFHSHWYVEPGPSLEGR